MVRRQVELGPIWARAQLDADTLACDGRSIAQKNAMTDYGSTTQRPWGSYPDEKQPSLDAVEIDDATFGGVENPCKRWPRLCGCMGIGVAILLLSATSKQLIATLQPATAGGGRFATQSALDLLRSP